MMLVLLVQGSHFEEQKEQELANLFYKVQIVNILAFVSRTVCCNYSALSL